jgi:hypothetical protein
VKAAEQATAAAKAATKSIEDAAKPGFLNLTVSGDFDNEVVISVDGMEKARSHGKQIGIDRVSPGPRQIAARAKKGTKDLETSVFLEVKPGVQPVQI